MKKILLKKIYNLIRNNQIEIVLIGEIHGWDKSLEIERSFLQSLKPGLFLHELLEDYTIKPSDAKKILTKKKWMSKVHSFQELRQIFSLISTLKIIGKGHDMASHGIKNIQNYYIKNRELTEKEEKDEQALIKRREDEQKEIILKILNNEKPVIAISGSYHLRNNSHLIKSLKDKKMALIYPSISGSPYNGKENFQIDKMVYIAKFLNVKGLKECLQVIG